VKDAGAWVTGALWPVHRQLGDVCKWQVLSTIEHGAGHPVRKHGIWVADYYFNQNMLKISMTYLCAFVLFPFALLALLLFIQGYHMRLYHFVVILIPFASID
jgi:hypothetical protein